MSIILDRLNQSSRSKFKKCPFAWKLGMLGVKGVSTDGRARAFGTESHKFVEEFYKRISDRPQESDITEVAQTVYDEIMKNINITYYDDKSRDVLNNFINFEIRRLRTWKVYKPTLLEKYLEAKLPSGLTLFGTIDFYGNRRGIDWKTGGNSLFPEDRMFQGKHYEILLRAHNFPLDSFMFMNLPTNQFMETPKVSDEWYMKEVNHLLDMVKSGNFPKNRTGLCDYCPYMLTCNLSEKEFWSDNFWRWS